MDKLKKIIRQTLPDVLMEFEKGLKGNNSVKLHTVLTAYKDDAINDDKIKELLQCNDNAFYVLKSRLFDKIQKFLLEHASPSHAFSNGTKINLNSFIYEHAPETAIAMLQQMEADSIGNDSPSDLIEIYSVLKKLHFYSNKYYTYSQLYNNHVAYALALEKAEETLNKFNRTLASYHFSDDASEIEIMHLLAKEIKNTYSLYKSPRIKLIQNIITIQMILFGGIDLPNESSIEDLLVACEDILKKYNVDGKVSFFKPVLVFLNFEYYLSLNLTKKITGYFESLEKHSQKWLLQGNSCLAYRFLLSKVEYLTKQDHKAKIGTDLENIFYDHNDIFTGVIVKYYSGLSLFYAGNLKSAIAILNDILNDVSFKNYFFMETEIKLALTYFYIKKNEVDMAESILRGLSRKLMGLKTQKYKNVRQAIKLLTLLINGIDSKSAKLKYQEAFEQLAYYNMKEKKVLGVLENELESLSN